MLMGVVAIERRLAGPGEPLAAWIALSGATCVAGVLMGARSGLLDRTPILRDQATSTPRGVRMGACLPRRGAWREADIPAHAEVHRTPWPLKIEGAGSPPARMKRNGTFQKPACALRIGVAVQSDAEQRTSTQYVSRPRRRRGKRSAASITPASGEDRWWPSPLVLSNRAPGSSAHSARPLPAPRGRQGRARPLPAARTSARRWILERFRSRPISDSTRTRGSTASTARA